MPENPALSPFESEENPSADAIPQKRRPRKAKKPRKISPDYLRNVALFYLERFAGTTYTLRQVLERRIRKAERFYEPEPALRQQWDTWLDEVIAFCQEQGFVDDAVFAKARAKSLFHKGNSSRQIRAKLREKGVSTERIDAALAGLSENNAEGEATDLIAARRYLQRRRRGAYRTNRPKDSDALHALYKKDLAALARVGFSYDIAKTALEDDIKDDRAES